MPAQDRMNRGPLAALLILLSLFLASGTAAATGGLQASGARPGSSRGGAAAALLPAPARNSLEDEASGAGAAPFALPPATGIVTRRLSTRPGAEPPSGAPTGLPRPATASYRARAPPAA